LSDLRSKYAELEAEGFVDADDAAGSKFKRYANDEADEKAAEKVIHREAIERSRVSMVLNVSMSINASMGINASSVSCIPTEEDNSNHFAPDDYGGGDDYYDADESGHYVFNDDFVAMDENGARFSSSSITNTNLSQNEFPVSFTTDGVKEGASTTNFLDSICSGEALSQRCSEYNYFNTAALDKLTSGNLWAGSAHWKKSERLFKKIIQVTHEKSKDRKRQTKKDCKQRTLIDLTSNCHECLHSLLKKTKVKAGRCTKTDQFLLSTTLKQKHRKERNILPPDARISIKQLSALFTRRNASFTQSQYKNTRDSPRKSVGESLSVRCVVWSTNLCSCINCPSSIK